MENAILMTNEFCPPLEKLTIQWATARGYLARERVHRQQIMDELKMADQLERPIHQNPSVEELIGFLDDTLEKTVDEMSTVFKRQIYLPVGAVEYRFLSKEGEEIPTEEAFNQYVQSGAECSEALQYWIGDLIPNWDSPHFTLAEAKKRAVVKIAVSTHYNYEGKNIFSCDFSLPLSQELCRRDPTRRFLTLFNNKKNTVELKWKPAKSPEANMRNISRLIDRHVHVSRNPEDIWKD